MKATILSNTKPLILILSLFYSIIHSSIALEVPSELTIVNTKVTITKEGKEIIQDKLSSLLANEKYYKEDMKRCLTYFPAIERILEEEGVPSDFKFLALQESVLDPNAISKSNAVGYWQFKQATAEEYQLRVDHEVDERKNLMAASRAAAQYLGKSHHYLNNWVYALLSYNLGLTGAKNHIAENDLTQEIIVKGDTHQYIVHFIAHYLAFNDAYKKNSQKPIPLYLLEYPGGIHKNWEEIAEMVLGIQDPDAPQIKQYLSYLHNYNQWLSSEIIPTNQKHCFSIILPIPIQKKDELITRLSHAACAGKVRGHDSKSFYADSLKNNFPFIMQIGMKEDGFEEMIANGISAIRVTKPIKAKIITKKLGIDLKKFSVWNEQSKIKILTENTIYYTALKPNTLPLSYHIMEPEETLSFIAQKYGIQLAALYKWNELESNYSPVVGDKIWFNPLED